MVTVHAEHGFRFVIFIDDHEPAHVHVFGDGQLKVDLGGASRPKLIWASGMKHGDIRKAMALVTSKRDVFLQRWKEIHGGPDN